jgi:hypothetical protein
VVLLKVAVVVVVVADVVLEVLEEVKSEEAVLSEVAAVLELIKATSSDVAAAHGHEHGAHTSGSSVDTTHIHATTNVTKQPTNK